MLPASTGHTSSVWIQHLQATGPQGACWHLSVLLHSSKLLLNTSTLSLSQCQESNHHNCRTSQIATPLISCSPGTLRTKHSLNTLKHHAHCNVFSGHSVLAVWMHASPALTALIHALNTHPSPSVSTTPASSLANLHAAHQATTCCCSYALLDASPAAEGSSHAPSLLTLPSGFLHKLPAAAAPALCRCRITSNASLPVICVRY